MTGLFKKQAPTEKTVLLVDIENGSVGCALVHLPAGKAGFPDQARELPKLFAETRAAIPMMRTFNIDRLKHDTDATLRDVLAQTSMTAARMRAHPKLSRIGTVASAAVFVSAPWTVATIKDDSLDWEVEAAVQTVIEHAIQDTFGDIPVSFYATSAAVAHATDRL